MKKAHDPEVSGDCNDDAAGPQTVEVFDSFPADRRDYDQSGVALIGDSDARYSCCIRCVYWHLDLSTEAYNVMIIISFVRVESLCK